MTLKCKSTKCLIHKMCSSYRPPISDKTVVIDHTSSMKRNDTNMSWECPFFTPKSNYFNKDLNTIHSPNTFNSHRSGSNGEFVIPRNIIMSNN
jgi:hypothetical protein